MTMDYKKDTKKNGKPSKSDQCQTPDYGTDTILPHLSTKWRVWEMACGEGYMVRRLEKLGFDVFGSDTEFDSLVNSPEVFDCIVTNPPYSLKKQFMQRCLELGKPFALLMPLETLGTKWCHEIYRDRPHMGVVLLDKRINFKMPNKGWDGGGAQFPVAWFTYGLQTFQLDFAEVKK